MPTLITTVPMLPRRPPEGHKGTFGRVLVVAGSSGLSGAAVLAGSAALRAGAGLVRVACPREVQPLVAVGNPCYTTAGLSHHSDGTFRPEAIAELDQLAAEADVLAVGPGLGNRPEVTDLVLHLLALWPHTPIVLDADALNALAPLTTGWPARPAPVVLTPHPGEFARLIGLTTAEVQAQREVLALRLAQQFTGLVVLKGAETLVTDGNRLFRNTTGNPGMATGGTGDVLTGIIAALIGQGLTAFDAATLGVWVHGRAGDLAAAELSQVALTARDLIDFLPRVFREQEESNTPGERGA